MVRVPSDVTASTTYQAAPPKSARFDPSHGGDSFGSLVDSNIPPEPAGPAAQPAPQRASSTPDSAAPRDAAPNRSAPNSRTDNSNEHIDRNTSRSICDAVGERLQRDLRPDSSRLSSHLQHLLDELRRRDHEGRPMSSN